VLKRSVTSFAFAVLLGASPWVQARASVQEPNAAASAQANTMIHLEGCVFTETALTATTPVVIPAGTTQAYVLTHTKKISGSQPDDEVAKTIYALDKIDQDQLRALYGKRVGVTGRVKTAPKRPQIEVVSIREISGGCPVLPSLPS
jgi:hypothetical protein